jgi:hypothetical protein
MHRTLALLALFSLPALSPGLAAGQPPAPAATPAAAVPSNPPAAAKSLLAVESIAILPADPGPDTLCQLRVKVRNGGTRKASALAFAVRVDGVALPVYKHQLYLQQIDPGATAEVRLFNFWTTETGRPLPKDGKLRVEVMLAEGRWVEVKIEGGAEVVTPGGTVAGLPVSTSLTVPLKVAARKPA